MGWLAIVGAALAVLGGLVALIVAMFGDPERKGKP